MSRGPLDGLRVVEFASIGPGPHCAMLLADLGADVLRIDWPGGNGWNNPVVDRGRAALTIDIRTAEGRDRSLLIIDKADVLIEGNRPGVLERLGLGPDTALARNPRLVYGRMTGWGQDGPLARAAGHDINYIALPGALSAFGHRDGNPVAPLNLVGDYGGGALYLAVGVLAGVIEARSSGRGQVVDVAMCDGVASLLSLFFSLKARGVWDDARRGANLLDGGAPYYRAYECADGLHVSIGALEPQFYATLCKLAGLEDPATRDRNDKTHWPDLTHKMEAVFKRKTRAEWCEILEGSDACFAPVLTMTEAPAHPHLAGRRTYVDVEGVLQPAPAPRFSRTPSAIASPPAKSATGIADVLADWEGQKATR
jgi:alpha-methylacyl-CoA racemase